MSFIPPKCDKCGDTLNKISNVNPNLICVNNDCIQEFKLIRVTNVTKLKKEVIK